MLPNLTLVIQGLAFFAVAWLVMKFIWPPIIAAMEERQQKIAEGLAAADNAQKNLAQAQDKAVANWRKNTGLASAGTTTQPAPRQGSAAPAPSAPQGADHSNAKQPDSELTRREAQTQMPIPGQANDHSTTARDPQNSSGRR